MIEFLKDFPEILFQIVQVDDHPVHRVDLALEGHFNDIIVPMRIFIIAGAKDLLILGVIPFGIVVAMRSAEFEAFGEGRFGHHKWLGMREMKKGPDFGLKMKLKPQPLFVGFGKK